MKKILFLNLIFVILTNNIIYSQSKKIEQLKYDYLESAFLDFNNNKLPIIKWENIDTLKYHVKGDFRYVSKKSWSKFINNLELLIDMKIVETDDISESNIQIYFGELNDYFIIYNIKVPNRMVSDFDNWHNRKYNSQKQLTRTSYCIVPSKTKDSKRGNFNLKKLFIKSIGLLGKMENEYSLFNRYQTDGNTRLMSIDKRIIKIHYDSKIKAGMPFQEVKNTLSKIDLNSIIKEKY